MAQSGDVATTSLWAAFGLRPAGELVALVGGGGKTSLLFALAAAAPGPVVLTTTTRIFAAQMRRAPAVAHWGAVTDETVVAAALARHGRCLVVGAVAGDKALGVPADVPGRLLARPDVTAVLVEADGSRMRPVKAPAAHEPVVPSETTLLVPVVGIDALDAPLRHVAHRPARVAALTGLSLEATLTPAAVAALLTHRDGGLKGAPPGARVVPFINKVESKKEEALADDIARRLLAHPRVARVVVGTLRVGRTWVVE